MKLLSECVLYGILDLGYISTRDCYPTARSMRQGGIDIIQLRAKRYPPSEIRALACSLFPLLADIPFILNGLSPVSN
jgi:thiamine-phosphate pyrophosphorylase